MSTPTVENNTAFVLKTVRSVEASVDALIARINNYTKRIRFWKRKKISAATVKKANVPKSIANVTQTG